MHNRGQLVIGAVLVVWGLLLLIGTIFQIDVGAMCVPVGLILVGVWLVLRPRMAGPDTNTEVLLIGDTKRRGAWDVRSVEYWVGIADLDLEMIEAVIPPGETKIKVYGFVGDVDLLVPKSLGISIQANGFVIDSDLFGHERDSVLNPVEVISDNYAQAEHRLRLEMVCFVSVVKVRQV